MASRTLKWILKAAIIPVVGVAYVSFTGLNGYCPTCAAIMDSVLGRTGTPIEPGPAKGSVSNLTVYGLDGSAVVLGQYVGKPLIIDVWATWCPPCRKQRTVLHDLDAEFLKTVNIVSLSTDRDPRLVETYIRSHPANSIELMSSPEALAAFGGVSSIPTLVFVDSLGQIRDVEQGVQSASELRRRVMGLAAAK